MIVLRLTGGLGNQLFQYAAGRALADRLGAELVLDPYWFHHTPRRDTPRTYALQVYPVRARMLQGAETYWAWLHQGRFIRRIGGLPRRWQHVRERHFHFDPEWLSLQGDCYLDGYWQSPRYFEAQASAIRQDLQAQPPMAARDAEVAQRIAAAQGQAVSVHVRRGDYVHHAQAASMHGLCGPDYYARAAQCIAQRMPAPQFFVFSDDMEWTRATLRWPGPCTFVDHNDGTAAFQDLRLMSLCDHHIVANSSFSWWGAWLASAEDRCVIAPQRWFAQGPDARDLLPQSWLRL